MAKITKSLSSKVNKDTKKAEIMLRFIYGNGKALRAKSGLYIDPIKWNASIGELKTANFGKVDGEFKKKLSDLCQSVLESFTETAPEQINKEWLDSVIDKHNFPEKYIIKEVEQKQPTLFDYIATFIESAPQRKDRDTGRLLSPNNIQQYRATYKHLQAFAKLKRKSDFEFSNINQKFYDGFVAYLQGLGFTANSVGKHIRILKLMLNEAPKELKAQANYDKYHVFTEDVDTVYLNEKELQQLKETDFGDALYLDRTRDWFLLLAWTGCRFSDLEKIGKTDIKDGFISFRQQKTNTKVTIPLHPIVVETLSKYDYKMPEPISNQRFNEYIKIACERAGITASESCTKTIGGQRTTTTHPKYELISSHTARRSFATNMYKQGLPSLMIMSITGHKTEKSYLKYIRVTQSEHAKMMADAWRDKYNKIEKGGQE